MTEESMMVKLPRSNLLVKTLPQADGKWSVKVINSETMTEKEIEKNMDKSMVLSIMSVVFVMAEKHGLYGKTGKFSLKGLKSLIKQVKTKKLCLNDIMKLMSNA